MDKMKELYEKVTKDGELQTKLAEIMKAAEKAGPDETGKKLVAFAKEEGYELTVDEIRYFFEKPELHQVSALSEEELDLVAGGKNPNSGGYESPGQNIVYLKPPIKLF